MNPLELVSRAATRYPAKLDHYSTGTKKKMRVIFDWSLYEDTRGGPRVLANKKNMFA